MLALAFENHRLHALRRHGSDLIWFVLADVCALLGLTNPRMVAKGLKDHQKGVSRTYTPGGPQEMLIVSEVAVYRLATRSNKPNAERFSDWLFEEALPEIRRTGSYHGGSGPLDDLIAELQPSLPLESPKPSITTDGNVSHVKWPEQPTQLFDAPSLFPAAPKVERDDRGLPKTPPWSALADPKISAEANKRHIAALIGEGHTPRGYVSDVEVEPVDEVNLLIGERSPPGLWGKQLTKLRAHHLRTSNDSFSCQCFTLDGKLREFRISPDPIRPTNMRERLLLHGEDEFLCRYDYDVSALVAQELLNRERACPKSPLTQQQAEAVMTLLLGG